MRVYDGESLKDTDPKAKSYQEYRDYAGVDEGMNGLSTRFAFKILSARLQLRPCGSGGQSGTPVRMCWSSRSSASSSRRRQREKYLGIIKGYLAPRYVEFIGKEIQTAYLESLFRVRPEHLRPLRHLRRLLDRGSGVPGPETGQLFDRASLNSELEKIEKPAGISNPKDFRNEIVNFVLRARANNAGRNPNWTSYEKLRTVIEKKMFSNTEELLPVISFNSKTSAEEQKKHDNFVERMMEKGYTRKQVRLLSEWYLRVRKVILTLPCSRGSYGAFYRPQAQRQKQKRCQSAALHRAATRSRSNERSRMLSPSAAFRTWTRARASASRPRTSVNPIFIKAKAANGRWCTRATISSSPVTRFDRPKGGGSGQGGGEGQASDQGEGADDFVFQISERRVPGPAV